MPTKITKATITAARPRAKPYEIYGQHGLVLRVWPSGKKIFYCQYGRAKRTKIGNAALMMVSRAEYLSREKLNQSTDPDNPLWQQLKKSTLGGYIEKEYSPWVLANRKRGGKTLTDLKRSFGRLYDKQLVDIERIDLDRYVASRHTAGSSAATIVRDLNNLRSVVTRSIDGGYLRGSPFKDWEQPTPVDCGVTRYLSADEENRLRRTLKKRDDQARRARARYNKWLLDRGRSALPEVPQDGYSDHLTPMVLTSVNTGVRYGELAGLQWPAVDFRSRILTVVARTAKGAKTRHLPLNDEALGTLKLWQKQTAGSALVFSNPDGSRIGSVKTAWLSVLSDAEIETFRWHDLRHTFASKLVQRGVDLYVVMRLMGHSDIKQTIRYAHLAPNQTTEAVDRLNR